MVPGTCLVSLEGVATDPEKPDAVQRWPPLRDKHKLRSFPVLCAYYRRYIAGLADIIKKFTKLTEKKQTYKWTPEATDTNTIKHI